MLYKYEEDYVEQEADYSIELLKQLATIPAPSYHEEKRAQFCKQWVNDYSFIQSGERFVTLILTGIIHGATVEYITSSIAGRVIRNSFLIGKTHYFDG